MVLVKTSPSDVEACCPINCIEAAFLILRLWMEPKRDGGGIIQFCLSGLGGSSVLRELIAVRGRARLLGCCLPLAVVGWWKDMDVLDLATVEFDRPTPGPTLLAKLPGLRDCTEDIEAEE